MGAFSEWPTIHPEQAAVHIRAYVVAEVAALAFARALARFAMPEPTAPVARSVKWARALSLRNQRVTRFGWTVNTLLWKRPRNQRSIRLFAGFVGLGLVDIVLEDETRQLFCSE